MKLLIVEDEQGVSQTLARLLKNAGWDSDKAHDWKEMQHMLSLGRYDLILLDLGLPDSSTQTTLSKTRLLKMQHPSTAICIITGQPNVDRRMAIEAGADDYVNKASMMQPGMLLQVISNLVSKVNGSATKKLQDQLQIAAQATHRTIEEMTRD